MFYALLLLLAAPDDDQWQEYRAARATDQLHEAARIAEQIVEAALRTDGEESSAFGVALGELGATQMLRGEHVAALSNLKMAEEVLRESEPVFSENLITSLAFLGAELQNRGRQEEAMDAFTRAQHITHRLFGANNPDQIPLVYAKAASALSLGEVWQAEELERFAHELHVENYGIDSRVTIAASARLGTWLRSIGDYSGSIAHFHAALKNVQGDGPDLPEAAPLLRGMAHAYRGGFRGKHARGFHERLIAVMAEHPERFSADERIVEHMRFGDWLMQRAYESDAVDQYESAWALAAEAGPDAAHWIETLSQPSIVRYEDMAPTDVEEEGKFVTFAFQLRTNGRPYRVNIADHSVSTRERSQARKTFRDEVRFRPAVIGGEATAVETAMVTMYLLNDDTQIEPTPASAPDRLTAESFDHGLDPYATPRTLLTLDVPSPR